MESHEPESRLPQTKERLTIVEKFVVPDPARCYRCLRRSRCRQPPSLARSPRGEALGRSSGRSALKPALEARKSQDGYQRRSASLLFPCSGSGARRLTQTHQRTKWPEREQVTDDLQGVQLDTI